MNVARLIAQAEKTFEIEPGTIMSRRRTRRICAARWCVMAKLYEAGWTGHRISKALNKHHTTVYHAMGVLSR